MKTIHLPWTVKTWKLLLQPAPEWLPAHERERQVHKNIIYTEVALENMPQSRGNSAAITLNGDASEKEMLNV